MVVPNNINVLLPSIFSLFFCASKNVFIDRDIGAPVHGKYVVDGINACDKQHLKRYMKLINQSHEVDEDRNIKPYLIDKKKLILLADECRRRYLEG